MLYKVKVRNIKERWTGLIGTRQAGRQDVCGQKKKIQKRKSKTPDQGLEP